MSRRSVVLLGGPDSGKTNYVGRLWPSFKNRRGVLRADRLPDDIAYVDAAVEHLMRGSFAPRSDRNLEVGRADFSIEVRGSHGTGEPTELMVPDISGELWSKAVATSEITQEWLDVLQGAAGAILFVRAHSDQIVKPLDWVTARSILKLHTDEDVDADDHADAEENADFDGEAENERPKGEGADGVDNGRANGVAEVAEVEAAADDGVDGPSEPDLPTQVLLCELLRYLDLYCADGEGGARPRVAVVVAAWDMLDPEERAAGPGAYLKGMFPLLAGRLAVPGRLDVRLFGLSVVGGDLADDPDFRGSFLQQDISAQGWVMVEDETGVRQEADLTLPIAWAMGD